MNTRRKLATFAAAAALVLSASTPNAQAETAYNVEFAGRITISTVGGLGLYYPLVGPSTSKVTRTITSLTTTACVADFASAKKTPGQGVGTCAVTLVAGSVGPNAAGQGPWCGSSSGFVVVDVTITDPLTFATKTFRATLNYDSAATVLVFDPLTSTVEKGAQKGPAWGTGTAVPDATTGHSCAPTGNGASAFLITASVSGLGVGSK